MHVHESSGPAILTLPLPRVGLPLDTDTVFFIVVPKLIDRQGNDNARHTNMVIVEDMQGSPIDTPGVQRMDVEDSPTHDQQPSASMGDVHMETLDLGGKDDNTEHIQQTHASQAECADNVMKTEAPAPVRITNVHSLITEEGADVCFNAAAPPPDNEVTHL